MRNRKIKHANSLFLIIITIHCGIIYLVLGLCIMNNERMTWPFDFGKQIYECAMEKKTTDIPLPLPIFSLNHTCICMHEYHQIYVHLF